MNKIEESIRQAAEELEAAMIVGNYKKVNELMSFLEEIKKAAEMAKQVKRDNVLEDNMVA